MNQTAELLPTQVKLPMPPVRKPREPKQDDLHWAMLLTQNIDAHVRWLRRGEPGHGCPHNLMQEILLSKLSHHLILAIEGKRWTPPQD